MGKIFRALLGFLIIPALIFLAIWGSERFVASKTASYRTTDTTAVPKEEVAVVFGAGVIQSRGEVGQVLRGRMDTAIKLYRDGIVDKLVLSGDSTSADHDEVTPMIRYATEEGVPEEALIEDRKGSSTYATCYRLNHAFSIKSAVLVTNEYHLPRAVFTCRKLGVDAYGLAAPNYAGYEINRNQREPLATVKMLIDLYVASPQVQTD